MGEKTRLQQFLDTKLSKDFYQVYSKRNLIYLLRILVICGLISSFAYISEQNRRFNSLTEGLIESEMEYDCKDLKRLLEEKNYEELDRRYPDTNNKIAITVVGRSADEVIGDVVYLSRRPLLNCLEPDHPYVIQAIKSLWVEPEIPAEPYYLPEKEMGYLKLESEKQPQALDVMQMIFKDNMTGGFFLEAGAQNCIWSVTLPLEANFGWKGLLVEANPHFYNQCLSVGRRTHIINTCLGAQKSPHFINFDFSSAGKVTHNNFTGNVMGGFAQKETHSQHTLMVQCYPVYSLLSAMGNPTVNLFVLDIEGYELDILRTIPWDKVDIEVITVETALAGLIQKDSSPEMIIKYMEDVGYTMFHHRNQEKEIFGLEQDHLFVRNDVVKKRNVVQLK